MNHQTTASAMPPRGHSLRKKEYEEIAQNLKKNQGVKTVNRKTTVGVLRALERLNRLGSQRTVDGELWVWRTI